MSTTPNIVALRELTSARIHDLARILRHRDMLAGTAAVAEASRIERALVIVHTARAGWMIQPQDADALIRLIHDAAENLAYMEDRAGEEETNKLLRWLAEK